MSRSKPSVCCLEQVWSSVAIQSSGYDIKSEVQPRPVHEGPEVEYRYSSALCLTWALDRVGGQRHASIRSTAGKENRYSFYSRLGWPQGKTGRPPPGFDPRTVQPIASRYTDYAMPAHTVFLNSNIKSIVRLHRFTALHLLLLLSTLGNRIYVKNPLPMQRND
jgi:hypothetical protein